MNQVYSLNLIQHYTHLVAPARKKLKLFDKSNREVDMKLKKRVYVVKIFFNFSEISDSAFTESFLEQCSSKSFEKQEFCPSTSNKKQLEQCSSKNSTCKKDLLKQSFSKSFREELPIPLSTEDSNESYGKKTSVLIDTDCQLKQNSTESLYNLYANIDGVNPVTRSERQQLYSEINNLYLERDLLMSKFMYFKFNTQFFSQYKKHCTIKCLISSTPLGAIHFISNCYEGISDNQTVRKSEFASSKYHMPGDQI
nr:uncharacterized protein LOC124816058 [Hydra vulgaris]